MEFSNLFLIQESFTVYTPNLFCLSDHLRNTFAAQSTYLICLYSLTLIWHDEVMRNAQTAVAYTNFPQNILVCGKSDILIQF